MIFNNFGFNTQATGQTTTGVPNAGGLFLYLDAGVISSYAGSGLTWTDLANTSGSNTVTFASTPTYINAGLSSYFTGSVGSPATTTAVTMSGLPAGSTAWSISAWFMNTADFTIDAGIATWGDFSTNTNFMFLSNNSSFGGNFSEIRGTGQPTDRPSCSPLVKGQWCNIAWTYTTASGGAKTAYFNGAKSQVVIDPGVNPATGVKTAGVVGKFKVLGQEESGRAMEGRYAVYRMWNVQLTSQQVLDDYNYFKSRYGLT